MARLTMICSVALLLAGCGGSSHSSKDELKASCTKATAARTSSHNVLAELGIEVTNKPLLERAATAIKNFRIAAEGLQRSASGAHQAEAAELVAALAQQEKEILAYVSGDVSAQQKYGVRLDQKLNAGFAALANICRSS